MLSIAATVMLTGAANLIAQERRDRPEARPRQRQKSQAEQPRRQRAGGEALHEHTKQMQQQRATKEARRKRMENLRGKPQPARPGQGQPAQPGQMFGRWLDELIKAYRANDREKMGQLLKKMHQLRREWQEIRGRGFQGRGIRRWGRGWQGRGIDRRGQSFQGRGMIGGWGRGFQGRGMLGRWGRGFQGRGIGRPGPGMRPPAFMEKPEPPMPPEDVDRPSPPMPRRGMGRRGRGSPEQ